MLQPCMKTIVGAPLAPRARALSNTNCFHLAARTSRSSKPCVREIPARAGADELAPSHGASCASSNPSGGTPRQLVITRAVTNRCPGPGSVCPCAACPLQPRLSSKKKLLPVALDDLHLRRAQNARGRLLGVAANLGTTRHVVFQHAPGPAPPCVAKLRSAVRRADLPPAPSATWTSFGPAWSSVSRSSGGRGGNLRAAMRVAACLCVFLLGLTARLRRMRV